MFTTIIQLMTIIAVLTLVGISLYVAYKLRATPEEDISPEEVVRRNVEEWNKAKRNINESLKPTVTMTGLHLDTSSTNMFKLYTDDKRLVGSISESFLIKEFGLRPRDLKNYTIEVSIINKLQNAKNY